MILTKAWLKRTVEAIQDRFNGSLLWRKKPLNDLLYIKEDSRAGRINVYRASDNGLVLYLNEAGEICLVSYTVWDYKTAEMIGEAIIVLSRIHAERQNSFNLNPELREAYDAAIVAHYP